MLLDSYYNKMKDPIKEISDLCSDKQGRIPYTPSEIIGTIYVPLKYLYKVQKGQKKLIVKIAKEKIKKEMKSSDIQPTKRTRIREDLIAAAMYAQCTLDSHFNATINILERYATKEYLSDERYAIIDIVLRSIGKSSQSNSFVNEPSYYTDPSGGKSNFLLILNSVLNSKSKKDNKELLLGYLGIDNENKLEEVGLKFKKGVWYPAGFTEFELTYQPSEHFDQNRISLKKAKRIIRGESSLKELESEVNLQFLEKDDETKLVRDTLNAYASAKKGSFYVMILKQIEHIEDKAKKLRVDVSNEVEAIKHEIAANIHKDPNSFVHMENKEKKTFYGSLFKKSWICHIMH